MKKKAILIAALAAIMLCGCSPEGEKTKLDALPTAVETTTEAATQATTEEASETATEPVTSVGTVVTEPTINERAGIRVLEPYDFSGELDDKTEMQLQMGEILHFPLEFNGIPLTKEHSAEFYSALVASPTYVETANTDVGMAYVFSDREEYILFNDGHIKELYLDGRMGVDISVFGIKIGDNLETVNEMLGTQFAASFLPDGIIRVLDEETSAQFSMRLDESGTIVCAVGFIVPDESFSEFYSRSSVSENGHTYLYDENGVGISEQSADTSETADTEVNDSNKQESAEQQ